MATPLATIYQSKKCVKFNNWWNPWNYFRVSRLGTTMVEKSEPWVKNNTKVKSECRSFYLILMKCHILRMRHLSDCDSRFQNLDGFQRISKTSQCKRVFRWINVSQLLTKQIQISSLKEKPSSCSLNVTSFCTPF